MFSRLTSRLSPQQCCVAVALLRFLAALGFCFAIIVTTAQPPDARADATAPTIRVATPHYALDGTVNVANGTA